MSLIVDVGSKEVKAGLSTEYSPSMRFSPYFYQQNNQYKTTQFINSNHSTYEFQSCVKNGEVDKEIFSATINEITNIYNSDSLVWIKSNDHPIEFRKTVFEECFEKCNFTKIYCAPSPVLVALSYGQTNAMVLECGHSSCWASIVFSGYLLESTLEKMKTGGKYLSEQLETEMKRLEIEIPMPKNIPDMVTDSFQTLMIDQQLDRLKETEMIQSFDIQSYCKNILFPNEYTDDNIGLQHLVLKSLMKCDYDVIMESSKKLVLAGGSSLFGGIGNTIVDSIQKYFPTLQSSYVQPESFDAQRYAAWRGGALIANTDAMEDVWITKEEYLEGGLTKAIVKCG